MFHLEDVIRTGSRLVRDARGNRTRARLLQALPPARCSASSYRGDVLRGNSLFLVFFSEILKQLYGLLKSLTRDVMFLTTTCPNE